ncbi:hypothetical protein V6N13_108685 [Hibiscus sabdariffa]
MESPNFPSLFQASVATQSVCREQSNPLIPGQSGHPSKATVYSLVPSPVMAHGNSSDGFDVVMGQLGEGIPFGNSGSSKRPRTLSLQSVVSGSKNSTGASFNLSAGLDHGVSRSE